MMIDLSFYLVLVMKIVLVIVTKYIITRHRDDIVTKFPNHG